MSHLRSLMWASAFSLAIALPTTATGISAFWNNPTGGLFSDPANWVGFTPPGAGDEAIFDLDATYVVEVDRDLPSIVARFLTGSITINLNGRDYPFENPPSFGPEQNGTLTIIDGSIYGVNVIGPNDGRFPLALRIGSGAQLSTGYIEIGRSRYGAALEVVDGGTAFVGYVDAGAEQTSGGRLLVDGSLSMVWADALHLSGDDTGELIVRNGALLLSNQTVFSSGTAGAFGYGSAVITDFGSEWINENDLVLGDTNLATLSIQDGASVQTGSVYLGRNVFADVDCDQICRIGDGRAVVSGEGSILRVSHALVVGGDQEVGMDGPAGLGSIEISSGAHLSVGNLLILWNRSVVSLDGGSLLVGTLAAGGSTDEVRILGGGALMGSGVVQGNVRIGGSIDPGGLLGSSGLGEQLEELGYVSGPRRLLEIQGNLVAQETAFVTIDIAGVPPSGSGEGYDAVAVGGTAQLGGEIVVNVSAPIAGSLPPSDVFIVLTAAGLSGTFANVASGGWIAEANGLGSFRVFYGPGSPYGANVVALTGFNSPACSDGLDNDGDGYTDYPSDPACRYATSTLERTECQDGINNDYAAGIDFDGGASVNGGVPISTADPQCGGRPWRNSEVSGSACGLGFEVTLALLPLALARRRRERSRDPLQP